MSIPISKYTETLTEILTEALTETLIETLRELESQKMKRNTAMTIIEASDMKKTIASIKRQISSIKHKSKRSQLMRVMKELETNIMSLKIQQGIVCVGEKINGEIYFKYIKSIPRISSYDYDDIFNVYQICIILFNILPASKNEIESLKKRIDNPNHNEYETRYFLNDEIDKNLPVIRTIYHVTKSTNYRNISLDWLDKDITIKLIVDHESDCSSLLSVCKAIGI